MALFSTLNRDIVDAGNLSGVQGVIDKYTASLSASHVYESPYTAPSAKYLNDLAALGSAASAGDLEKAKSVLAKAKLDAPDNASGGMASAKAKGDVAGAAGLAMEVRANMIDYLTTQGYSSTDATIQANAFYINACDVLPSDATPEATQIRVEQVTDLAVSIAKDAPSTQREAVVSGAKDPMFDILSTLIATAWESPMSVTASNRSLALLESTYGSNRTDANQSANSEPEGTDSPGVGSCV